MGSRRFPRVEVDHRTYDLLRVEEVLSDKSIKEILAKLVKRGVSEKAIEVLDHKTTLGKSQKTTIKESSKTKGPQIIDMECHTVGDTEVCEVATPEKPKLSENPDALAQIKELWASGEHNAAAIARQIGYHRKTTYDNIKKMKERGELQEDAPEPQKGP
jgi:hypothetical protein